MYFCLHQDIVLNISVTISLFCMCVIDFFFPSWWVYNSHLAWILTSLISIAFTNIHIFLSFWCFLLCEIFWNFSSLLFSVEMYFSQNKCLRVCFSTSCCISQVAITPQRKEKPPFTVWSSWELQGLYLVSHLYSLITFYVSDRCRAGSVIRLF